MAQEHPPVEGSADRQPARNVVAFDFDGTLTTRDSYMAFLRWRSGLAPYALGLARLAPAGLAYLVHRDRGRIKEAATRVFLRGVPRSEIVAGARMFADRVSASLLRPDALAAWKRWRGEAVRLVIVTASPDLVVAPFAHALGADNLLGTQLEFDAEDRATGRFTTANCRGAKKVVRLKAEFGEGLVLKAAYGDTSGDREMLAMAEIQGYRVFRGTP